MQPLTSKLPDSKQGTNSWEIWRTDESSFIDDFKTLPFAASFGVSDLDDKLKILGSFIKECIDRNAPLKLTKVTRPPAPWLKDPAIAELKEQRDCLRSAARASNNNEETWEKFCAALVIALKNQLSQPRETSWKECCHLRKQKKCGR